MNGLAAFIHSSPATPAPRGRVSAAPRAGVLFATTANHSQPPPPRLTFSAKKRRSRDSATLAAPTTRQRPRAAIDVYSSVETAAFPRAKLSCRLKTSALARIAFIPASKPPCTRASSFPAASKPSCTRAWNLFQPQKHHARGHGVSCSRGSIMRASAALISALKPSCARAWNRHSCPKESCAQTSNSKPQRHIANWLAYSHEIAAVKREARVGRALRARRAAAWRHGCVCFVRSSRNTRQCCHPATRRARRARPTLQAPLSTPCHTTRSEAEGSLQFACPFASQPKTNI